MKAGALLGLELGELELELGVDGQGVGGELEERRRGSRCPGGR